VKKHDTTGPVRSDMALRSRFNDTVMGSYQSYSVTVYSKNNCAQCVATTKFLDRQGTQYEVVKMEDEEHRVKTVAAEYGYMSLPIIVVESDELQHWSGFRPDLLRNLT